MSDSAPPRGCEDHVVGRRRGLGAPLRVGTTAAILLLPFSPSFVHAQNPPCPRGSTESYSGVLDPGGGIATVAINQQPCEEIRFDVSTTGHETFGAAIIFKAVTSEETPHPENLLFYSSWLSFGTVRQDLPPTPPWFTTYRGTRGLAGRIATVTIENASNGGPATYSLAVVRTPRPRYNLGGTSFESAPLIPLTGVNYGTVHGYEPGQYYKVHIPGGQTIFLVGHALASEQGGANFVITLYDASQGFAQTLVAILPFGWTAFPSGAPTTYTNPSTSGADYYLRVTAHHVVHDFSFSVQPTMCGLPLYLEGVDGRAHGEDSLLVTVGEPIQFTTDVAHTNCTDLQYQWNFGDGSTSAEPDPTYAYERVGMFQPKMTVTCSDCEEVEREDVVSVDVATRDVTAVAWVDSAPIKLEELEDSANAYLVAQLKGGFVSCNFQLLAWSRGNRLLVYDDVDRQYANAFLLFYSANEPPPPVIDPEAYAETQDYRLLNRLQALIDAGGDDGAVPMYLRNDAFVGPTLNPCGGLFGVLETAKAEEHPANGAVAEGAVQNAWQLTEGRLGTRGQEIDRTLNACDKEDCSCIEPGPTTPWIWSVVKFNTDGELTSETQMFPTYSIYEDGELLLVVPQSDPEAFIALDSENSEKLPGDIE